VLLAALVAVAPVVWALVDVAVTGDPLFSLNATSSLAEALGRERGIGNVPSAFVSYLTDVARPPVALAGAAGVVLAVRRFGLRAMAVPLALLAAGMLTFVATGVAGLSILPRYLTVPAVALCVMAGYAVGGFETLPAGVWRERWRTGAYVALALGVAFVGLRVGSFNKLRGELRFNDRTHGQLEALLRDPDVRAGIAAQGLRFPTYRAVPDARWILDAPAGRIGTRAVDRRSFCRGIDVYVRGTHKELTRFGQADGVPRTTNRSPRGRVVARSGPFVAYRSCGEAIPSVLNRSQSG
jgi:hypothetical protein